MQSVTITNLSPEELSCLLRGIVREEIAAHNKSETLEKLLSPAEACQVFQPAISRVTLGSWTKQGLLRDHRIGGRVFYKRGELLEAGKTIKRYKQKGGPA